MKMNKSRESHEYEQNLKKSWKWIKAGKVMNMNKISKSHENNKNRESHEYEQNLKKSWKWIKAGKVMNMNKI